MKSPTRRQVYRKRKLPCACCGGRTWKPRRWVMYHVNYCCHDCACIDKGLGRWDCVKHSGMQRPDIDWRFHKSNSCQAMRRIEKQNEQAKASNMYCTRQRRSKNGVRLPASVPASHCSFGAGQADHLSPRSGTCQTPNQTDTQGDTP